MTFDIYPTRPSTLSARMLTSSESQWPAGQKGRRMSRAFTIFTKLVMTWIAGDAGRHNPTERFHFKYTLTCHCCHEDIVQCSLAHAIAHRRS